MPKLQTTIPGLPASFSPRGALRLLMSIVLFKSLFAALPAVASPADLCLTAARTAAMETGVPLSVLVAIAQTESGREQGGQVLPWPWTINLQGEGHWFATRPEAEDFARQAVARTGADTSYDAGCFQINARWHGEAFASLSEMFDPLANARYAATFLAQLRADTEDWSSAAGAYHSRTAGLADRYRARFDAFHAAALEAGLDAGLMLASAGPPPERRENRFPLLRPAGGLRALGSLVPLGAGG